MKTLLTYGGGTNSTAIILGLYERNERPDWIVFADTGAEKPHTYAHLWLMNQWLLVHGFPEITVVKGSMPQQLIDGSLENECLRLGCLPSKAYGFSSCSQKWKIDPVNKWIKTLGVPMNEITRLVGFDLDEPERVERAEKLKHKHPNPQRYPLVEWGMGREECIALIDKYNIPRPGKSACYFCPSSKKKEIVWLRDTYPELFKRALEIERRAMAGEGQAEAARCGLGRNFTWKEFIEEYDRNNQCTLSDAGIPEIDCGCYD